MPSTMTVRPKPLDATVKRVERPEGPKATREPKAAAARSIRAASCTRCAQARDGRQRGPAGPGARGPTSRPTCDRRARSTSTAARSNPEPRRAAAGHRDTERGPEPGLGPGLKEHRGGRPEAKAAPQSSKAFTVIPPNPKKRREIQKKAEAELAALEELRLSRTMAYVSISPRSVGGCLSLEEVRLKQQQELTQTKRKPKQIKPLLMEESSVVTR